MRQHCGTSAATQDISRKSHPLFMRFSSDSRLTQRQIQVLAGTVGCRQVQPATILDPVYGFGGDGSRTTGCITNSPFANYTNSLGTGYEITNHCIHRSIDDAISAGSAQTYVDACLAMRDFETAWPCIEGQPHIGGHAGIGGQMGNGVSSPGDPLFYLHHTWLDKILFWDWQARDRPTRVKRVAGTNTEPDFAPGSPPGCLASPGFCLLFLYLPRSPRGGAKPCSLSRQLASISQETDRRSR